MDKKKLVIAILLFFLAGFLFGRIIINFRQDESAVEEKQEVTIQKETDSEYSVSEDNTVEQKEADLEMDIQGLSDEWLEFMGISKSEISEALAEWTDENGYLSASGAVFYDPMWVRFVEEKYTMDCTLIFSDEYNGIPPEEVIITMDYYKKTKEILFHML